MHYSRHIQSGFILPALVVFSLVLMSIGLVGMQYITSSTGAIQATFYNNLAKEAANAGAVFAYQCLHSANSVDSVPWNNGGSGILVPNYDCNGYTSASPNLNRVNTAIPNTADGNFQKGWLNETKGASIVRTTFEVAAPSTSATNPTDPDISNSGTKITATGKVQFFYAGSDTPTRTLEQRTVVNIPINMADDSVDRAEGRAVTQVSSGMNFSCAVANQEMYCWGANNANQLGLSQANAQSITWNAPFGNTPPEPQTVLNPIYSAWYAATTLWNVTFGYGIAFFGGLWDVTAGNINGIVNPLVNRPTRISTGAMAPDKRVDSLAAGTISGCAVIEGRGACWGANPHGQIGNGDKSKFLETIQTMMYLAALLPDSAGGAGMVAAAVYAYNVASEQFLAGDNLYTSGRYYPTYIGNSQPATNPTYDAERWDLKNITKISTSAADLLKIDRNNTCAISNGEIGCWGSNNGGQMNESIYATGSINQTCNNQWVTRTAGALGSWSRSGSVWSCGGSDGTDQASLTPPTCLTGSVGTTATGSYYARTAAPSNMFNPNIIQIGLGYPSGYRTNATFSTTPTPYPIRALCQGTIFTPEVGAPAVASGFTDHDYYTPHYMIGHGGVEGSQYSHLWNSTTNTRKNAIDTAVGIGRPCVLVGAGEVYCWNGSDNNRLATPAGSNTRKNIPGNTPITSIAGGGNTQCGIGNGKLYCWGNFRGNGTSTTNGAPVEVTPSGATLDNVYSFNDNTGAICATGMGKAWCWGKNLKWKGGTWGGSQSTPEEYGGANLMGLPTGSKITQMSPGAGGDNIAAIVSGVLTSVGSMCAVTNATAYCVGDNLQGQLGRGNLDNSTSGANNVNVFNRTWLPAGTTSGVGDVNTIGLTRGKAATYIDAGNKFTCAVIDAQPYCWGQNTRGQLGNGSTNQKNRPTGVSTIGNNYTTKVSAGDLHACSVTDGRAYCWGANDDGRLGNGNTTAGTDTPSPIQVASVIGSMAATEISAGAKHTAGDQTAMGS